MKDEPIVMEGAYAKQYTEWHLATGGFARDMTLRDYFAGLAMQVALKDQYEDGVYVGDSDSNSEEIAAMSAYVMANAMIQERTR